MGINVGGSLIGGAECAREGLKVWLDAGNGSSAPGGGTTWKDLSQNGNDAEGEDVDTTDLIDGYWNLTPTEHFIITNTFGSTFAESSFTFEVWVKVDVWDNSGLFMCGHTGNSYGLYIQDSDDSLRFGVRNSNQYIAKETSLSTGVWYYAVGVHTAGSNVKLYIGKSGDDVPQLTETTSAPSLGDLSTSEAWHIGCKHLVAGGYVDELDGKVAIVRAYNRAISKSEINYNWHADRGRFGI